MRRLVGKSSGPGRGVPSLSLTLVLALVVSVVVAATLARPTSAHATAASFQVGAAVVDYTPPCGPEGTPQKQHCTSPPAGFTDPADCSPPASAFSGPRLFAFEEPYVDAQGSGHYDLGDPFLDCNGDGRWDGNFLGGGGGSTRFYGYVADPVTARAIVVSNGQRTISVEVLDHEGLFNVYQDQVRQKLAGLLPLGSSLKPEDVFISSTHDESAPDSIGLYNESPTVSSVNPYWVDYVTTRSAQAIVRAYSDMRPATIRYAEAQEPANLRQCWSSYPYIDDQLMPTLQAVDLQGKVIATLTDVSQHTESLGFNGGAAADPAAPPGTNFTLDQERLWVSADWPVWFRGELEQTYGGVAIEMAGSVGSNETPEVFTQPLSRTPQRYIDESHPAACATLFDGAGTKVALGYYSETRQLGLSLAGTVKQALDHATDSGSNDIYGTRAQVCVPVQNALFAAAAAAGTFAGRPEFTNGCTVQVQLPTGSTAGTEFKSAVAFFRIGDGEFASVPGEVFPFTYLRGFQGPSDMPCPDPNGGSCPGSGTLPLSPWLMPRMHTSYRFINGLGEDLIGYIFPQGNAVGIPGQNPAANPTASHTDRFGCGHLDDAESANSQAGDIVGTALSALMAQYNPASETIETGRYVMPDGTLGRDPLGTPEVKCSVDAIFTPKGPAVAVWLASGQVLKPARWMSLSGGPQPSPDRNTRGYFDVAGTHHWLDVFPDIQGAPAQVALAGGLPAPGGAPASLPNTSRKPASGLIMIIVLVLTVLLALGLRFGRARWRRQVGTR